MSLDFKLKRALRGLDQPRPLWAPLWMGPLDAEGIAELFGCPVDVEELYSESWTSWEECDSPDPLDKLTSWFVNLYLQDDILTKVDRTSMMCSLEVRSPFLDIDLVNFCRTLPVEARLHRGRTTKALLRLAARDLVPKHTLERSKQGFSLPVGSWFRSGDLQLYGGLGLQDAAVVNRRSAAHKAGKLDDRLFLYCQWVLESFAKNQ
jgi:asparagine synthase (glutamine-hydrolysing)